MLVREFQTKSERLFRDICIRHEYTVGRICCESEARLKTADYEVLAHDLTFIAEVKELTPNEQDLQIIRELKERGYPSIAGGGEIGSRVRVKIRQAAKQLRRYSGRHVPMILVLYDNVATEDGRASFPDLWLEGFQIDAAMYGHLVAHVTLNPGGSQRPDKSGPNRTLTESEKKYVSAIAVISSFDDKTVKIYHNRFAEVKLPTTVFDDAMSTHFEKRGEASAEPWKWHKIER
jgi:hypothetical protein